MAADPGGDLMFQCGDFNASFKISGLSLDKVRINGLDHAKRMFEENDLSVSVQSILTRKTRKY